jgi:crotonobetainyl-CoA:carnitine CoA-transferase CaiB-like acyl-CoA transferase
VIDFLQGVFATRTQAEWVAWFEGRDIGFGPVKTLREAFADPHANARGMHLLDADGGEHIGVPVRYASEPGHPRFTWPAVGEQTHEVLRESGYDDAAIAALAEQGAFTAATAPAATAR